MTDHTTPETSKRLKEAGFPQPGFEVGQFFVDPKDEVSIVIVQVGSSRIYWQSMDRYYDFGSFKIGDPDSGFFVFRPTATDILKELPGYTIHYKAKDGTWAVWSYQPDDLMFQNANPAEAAALAWLARNKKK